MIIKKWKKSKKDLACMQMMNQQISVGWIDNKKGAMKK